jgi:hypothetical protein
MVDYIKKFLLTVFYSYLYLVRPLFLSIFLSNGCQESAWKYRTSPCSFWVSKLRRGIGLCILNGQYVGFWSRWPTYTLWQTQMCILSISSHGSVPTGPRQQRARSSNTTCHCKALSFILSRMGSCWNILAVEDMIWHIWDRNTLVEEWNIV